MGRVEVGWVAGGFRCGETQGGRKRMKGERGGGWMEEGERLILSVRRAGYAEFVRWWMTHEGRGEKGRLTANL